MVQEGERLLSHRPGLGSVGGDFSGGGDFRPMKQRKMSLFIPVNPYPEKPFCCVLVRCDKCIWCKPLGFNICNHYFSKLRKKILNQSLLFGFFPRL